MTKSMVWEGLERVALVTKDWANDTILPASLRHMSLHLYRLATGVRRSKQPLPASVRNIESMFCSMCQRIKAGPCECEVPSLDHCPVLKNVVAPIAAEKIVAIRLSTALPDPACDFAAYRLCIDNKRRHPADGACGLPSMPSN